MLFGVTGFTGRLVAEYLLAARSDSKLRLAFAGRNLSKLEMVRRELASISPSASGIPLLRADSFDRASLDAIARDAAVVCTTVGPYQRLGGELVSSCVRHGTDYCDLTGEVAFMKQSIALHHEAAMQSGARIVHACGFDSIPSDLGVFMLSRAMKERHRGHLQEVRTLVQSMRGAFSGGTVATLLETIDALKRDPSLRKVLADPHALEPDQSRGTSEARDLRGPRRDPESKSWLAPFLMAPVNTRVVGRSQALLGHPNGRSFRYVEALQTGRGIKGAAIAFAVSGALGGFLLAASLPPTRALLVERLLPSPGDGPTAEQRTKGFFRMALVATGTGEDGRQRHLRGRVADDLDPGYGSTAKMLGETALGLARDEPPEGALRTGVLTPASALGSALIARLRRAGMTFEVNDVLT